MKVDGEFGLSTSFFLSHSFSVLVILFFIILLILLFFRVLQAMGAGVRESVNKGAAKILRDSLLSSDAAIPLLLLIAQIRSRILFCTETRELKLISHLYDTAQDVLMQFTDFLVAGAR